VDYAWINEKLSSAKIYSDGGGKTAVRYGGEAATVQLEPGEA
jgi:hypothetical protein